MRMLDIFDFIEFDGDWNIRWRVARPKCRKGDIAGSTNSQGYVQVTVNGVNYYAHRLVYSMAYGIELASLGMIDHIDGNKANNRPSNLRQCDRSTNGMNRSSQSNSTSKLKGVSFRKDRNKWLAKITRQGKAYHIGLYDTKEDASEAYRNAMYDMHGEFASL